MQSVAACTIAGAELLLRGGAPNPVINFNATASALLCAAVLAATPVRPCASEKIIGFDGWKLLPSGQVVRGVARIDALIFSQPDFAVLPAPVRKHVQTEIAMRCAEEKSEMVEEASTKSCDQTIRGSDDAANVHYDPSNDDGGCSFRREPGVALLLAAVFLAPGRDEKEEDGGAR